MERSTIAPLVQAQTSFAFDFLKEVTNGRPGAVCCSPFSVSVCLAMLYAGARGETRKEIEQLIAGDKEVQEADIHAYFAELLDQILKRKQHSMRKNKFSVDMFMLETANKLYVREGMTLKEKYEKIVNDTYAGMMEQVDFNDAEEVCKKINDWVNESTHGLIKETMTPGDVRANSGMMIMNAVYFNSKWELEFDEELTREGEFRIDRKRTKKVDFLNMTEEFSYYENKNVQVVRLPYKGEAIANYIFLPKEVKEIGSLFEGFDSETIGELIKKVMDAKESKVTLKLPKFEVDTRIDLKSVLKSMGMTRSFEVGNADFSGITDEKPFFVDDAVQDTCIKVNEKGTEAACVTRFCPMTTGPMRRKRKVEFIADHPFFYFIVEESSMCVLFAGTFT